ncbi:MULTISPECIES: hypothetical protein [unclassified Salinibacterium]|nr:MULTISPECIES: hypothetical protein [unclassified Salinibacterium]
METTSAWPSAWATVIDPAAIALPPTYSIDFTEYVAVPVSPAKERLR